MKLNKVISGLISAVLSVSMIGVFSAGAEETEEKLYTFQEILDMSDEEFFATFPDAESDYEANKKHFYETVKNHLIRVAENEYGWLKDDTTETLEEYIENYLSTSGRYKVTFCCTCDVTGEQYENSEIKYIPNITEKKLKDILGDHLIHIQSPIALIESDVHLFFEDQLTVETDIGDDKRDINDENLLYLTKFRSCVKQVMPYVRYAYIAPYSSSPAQKEVFTGDVNLDETVDLYDVIWIAKHLIHVFDLSEGQQKVGDINADGVCDLYDAIEIARTLIVE